MIAINLSKPQVLDTDLKAIKNFTGNLGWAEGATVFFITKEGKESIWIFHKDRVQFIFSKWFANFPNENNSKTDLKCWLPWFDKKKNFHVILFKTAFLNTWFEDKKFFTLGFLNSLNRKRWLSVKKDDRSSNQISIKGPNFNAKKGVDLSDANEKL